MHSSTIKNFGSWILGFVILGSSAWAAPIITIDNYELNDASRARHLPLKIYYPKQELAGGYPVVIFSHGSGGSKDGYSYLGQFWAENGYVVIHVTHLEYGRIKIQSGKMLVSGSWVPIPEWAKEQMSSTPPENWVVKNRALDISFIIDSLSTIAEALPELGKRMDRTRIGVAGHSEGASTVMAVAGAVLQFPAWETRAFGDPRIKAFIAMGPWTPGEGGFFADSWVSVTRPMLTMAGSKERTNGGTPKDPMLQILRYMPSGGKFHVTVTGANHSDFGDDGLEGAPWHDFIKRVALAFWNAALVGSDPSAASFDRSLAMNGIVNDEGLLSGAGAKGQLTSK